MRAHELLELGDQVRVASEGEVGLDPVLERREPELVEPRDFRLPNTS